MKAKIKNLDKKMAIRYAVIALFVALAVYCSVTLINNYADIAKLNSISAKASAEYEEQLKENEKVKAILDSKNKDEYIEQKAREKGYAKDGETVFYDISSSK